MQVASAQPKSKRPGSKRKVQVTTVEAGTVRRRGDVLATEEPLDIRVSAAGVDVSVGVTMRTPGNDFELAAGFLYAEGIVSRPEEILSIRYCVDAEADGEQRYNVVSVALSAGARLDREAHRREFPISSSCGVCGKRSIAAVVGAATSRVDSALELPAETLLSLPPRLREAQALFERTGGLHAAALFNAAGELLRLREDVGRHNALDKLIGAGLMARELPLIHGVVVVSGRLSFELVQKASRAGIPILAGVSAPSSLAVELAEAAGMTLVGFLREGRFNVYAGGERISSTPMMKVAG